jgi:superfamily II DNA/RNA helicase
VSVLLDSRPILRKFGKVEGIEIGEMKPEHTSVTFQDISPKFPVNWKLYRHQVQTIEALKKGKNVVLCSGTSSGKTEAVLLGFIEKIKPRVPCQVLYVYPTKVLTSDQMNRFSKYLPPYGLKACMYDYDHLYTRAKEIQRSEFVLTNTEMLLKELKDPSSNMVSKLQNLRYIVLDEAHIYTAYQVNLLIAMARVIRECINADFNVIVLSATIGNPEQVAEVVSGINKKQTEIIFGKPSHPKAKVLFLSKITRFRYEYLPENFVAAELAKQYAHDDASTIIFNDTIKDVGMIGSMVYRVVGDRVAIHYGSLGLDKRAEAEDGFKKGHVKVIITAKTLQQGIDIGTVQRVVHVGLPDRQSDFWQRQGRMGRREHIKLCESIVLPSPRSAFDIFICGEPARFQEFLRRRIERVIVKPDSKIAMMFLGCVKSLYGKPLDDREIELLQTLKLIRVAPSLESYLNSSTGASVRFELSPYGRKFLEDLHFYLGETIDVFDDKGNQVKDLRVYSIFSIQPNCILFNNDLRHQEFYLVDELDEKSNTAYVRPVPEVFPEDVVESIKQWKRFSLTKVDFTTTNPDSTFGNIILKPVGVYHLESRRSRSDNKLKIVEIFRKVAGQEEFPSNYVRADIPSSLLDKIPDLLHDESIIETILEAAFSCVRHGLREKFDIGYDEFSHKTTVQTDPSSGISAEFLFYETSCSDLIYDLNWDDVRESAKSFLAFVRKINDARFFYVRGGSVYFAQINDLPKNIKTMVYNAIEHTIDIILDIISEKLKLSSKVKEDESICRIAQERHEYADVCISSIVTVLRKCPEMAFLEKSLSVFLVDDYMESGHALQKATIGASRARDLEGRYVVWLSIPAVKKLSKNAVTALVYHEFLHLLRSKNRIVFESAEEEEIDVHASLRKETRFGKGLVRGDREISELLNALQAKKVYIESELMTTTGKIIENLRWQKSSKIGYVHVIRQGTEFRYHVLSK